MRLSLGCLPRRRRGRRPLIRVALLPPARQRHVSAARSRPGAGWRIVDEVASVDVGDERRRRREGEEEVAENGSPTSRAEGEGACRRRRGRSRRRRGRSRRRRRSRSRSRRKGAGGGGHLSERSQPVKDLLPVHRRPANRARQPLHLADEPPEDVRRVPQHLSPPNRGGGEWR